MMTLSELLMLSTVRLTNSSGHIGTGFFFEYNIEGKTVPVLVTNKHVILNKNLERVNFKLNKTIDNVTSNGFIDIEYNAEWNLESQYDLCFAYVGELLSKLKEEHGIKPFNFIINESLILDENGYKELDAIEEVIMIGYPIGLADEYHNLPIVRSGITASHPFKDYSGKKIGLVDMSCYRGSSGSPIFIYNRGEYKTRSEHFIGKSRLVLLGILYSGHTYSEEGIVKVMEVPTLHQLISSTKTMINLGLYVKSTELIELKKYVYEDLSKSGLIDSKDK
jgi:V8-like Glu-specific endopeptidase